MSEKHFDVVVLGRSLGAMAAAALLARRDFRVLVLGQGSRPATYQFRDMTLRRRPFTLLSATSPAFKRIFAELAQSQVFRRHMQPLDPMVSILMPGRRFDVPPDLELFQREIDREFPEVRRVIDDLYTDLARVNAAADTAFERDLCWPPGTFWEKRDTMSAAANVPYLRQGETRVLMGDFPPNHSYVHMVLQSAAFASNLAPGARPLPPFALARLHGAWTRGLFGVAGGEDNVVDFLCGRITALGGVVQLNERAVGLNVAQRGDHELVLDGQLSSVGASFIITDEPGESLANLAQGQGIVRSAQRDWPLVASRAGRFTVSLVVRSQGLPEPLGAESFIFPRMPGAPPDPLSPVVHLQRIDRLEPDAPPSDNTLLVAEVIIPSPGNLPLSEARQIVVNTTLAQFPFLQRHLMLADSTCDGLPVWVYENGHRTLADRLEARGSASAAESMPAMYGVDPPGFLGIGGEPLRGPIARTFLVGKSVLPSLGQEGEMLAAWSVARIITRTDKRRERMRRDMWSRIEFG
ncbi:MAG: phytoene dehydrogenase [Deltaproteobacteria bacterium]|nr:phytoene dehydrogenase [Deltaproteobacteria bacterium]